MTTTVLFWLSQRQWRVLRQVLPTGRSGPPRQDDHRIISGILHVLRSGCRWRDCPRDYGPYTTVYNRFNRWSRSGVWATVFSALTATRRPPRTAMVDSSAVKAHRCASGGRGGEAAQAIGRSRGGRGTKIHAVVDGKGRPYVLLLTGAQIADISVAEPLVAALPASRSLLADKGYDADRLRARLAERGTAAVIPSKSNRKQPLALDSAAYRNRNLIERMFCRLKDYRRIATRYDKLAINYLSSLCLAASLTWWAN
jgi:transposase